MSQQGTAATDASRSRGAMRTRLVIETPAESPDGSGGFTVSWSTFTSAWGKVEFVQPKKGGESPFADQVRATAFAKVTIAYQAGITERMRVRIVSTGVLLNIRNLVDIDMRHRYLEILGEAGVAQ